MGRFSDKLPTPLILPFVQVLALGGLLGGLGATILAGPLVQLGVTGVQGLVGVLAG